MRLEELVKSQEDLNALISLIKIDVLKLYLTERNDITVYLTDKILDTEILNGY